MATTAERIGMAFNNDGRRFEDEGGRSLRDCCIDAGAKTESVAGQWRAIFDDGSSIVENGWGWDVGYGADCWCWRGCGHVPDCEMLAHCECGEWSGCPCEWSGDEGDRVDMVFVPAEHRDTLAAAYGNGEFGPYSYAGVAVAISVSPACARRMAELDSAWVVLDQS